MPKEYSRISRLSYPADNAVMRRLSEATVIAKRSKQYKASRVGMPKEYLRISRLSYPADNDVVRRLSEAIKA